MGNKQPTTSKQELYAVRHRAADALPAGQVTGRYHTRRRLEEDYILEDKELGTGYNGSVHLAISKVSREKCAVKPFRLFRITKVQKRELKNEVEIFLAMDHPHVARLRDVYEGDELLHLVMECLEGGELFDRISRMVKFDESDAAYNAHQMLLAVAYLHSRGMVHRDLKPENFLYDSKNYDHLKLIDFGFSRFTHNKRMKLGCGTLAYMAPEVLDGTYDNKCDMWSMGVVVYIMVLGQMPFIGEGQELTDNIKSGQFRVPGESWARLSSNCQSFVSSLLQVDIGSRPSAQQALDHPWIMGRQSAEASSLDDNILTSLESFSKASRFRRACMSLMAWSITNEERAKVRKAFIELDHDNSGTITLGELKRVIQENRCSRSASNDVQRIFDALDSNSKEEVCYSDFLAAMMSTHMTLNEETVVSTFRRFDTEGTGFITANNICEILGSCVTKNEAQEMLREADINSDGKISQQEFMDYIHGRASTKHLQVFGEVIEKEKRKSGQAARSETPKSRACVLL